MEKSSVVSMSEDGRILALGEPDSIVDGVARAGAVAIYERSGDAWTRTAYLHQDSPLPYADFGFSAALSADGSTLVVAHRGGLGGVSIYVHSAGGWTQSQEIANPSSDLGGGLFAAMVAVDGDGRRVAIADSRTRPIDEQTQSDRIYVYERPATGTWTLTTTLTPGGGSTLVDLNGWMGFDRAGETLLVGAPDASDGRGVAYFYARSEVGWAQAFVARADAPQVNGWFARDAALSADGTTALIGTWNRYDSSGFAPTSVQVYTKSAGVWSETAVLSVSAGHSNFGLNGSLAINADGTVAVATTAFTELAGTNEAGIGYVFTRSGSAWTYQSTFLLPVSGLASSLAFNGRTLAYGPSDLSADDSWFGTPTVRVFDLKPTLPVVEPPTDRWGYAGRPIEFTATAASTGLAASWQVSLDRGKTWLDAGAGATATIAGQTRAWLAAVAPSIPDTPSGEAGIAPLYRVTFVDPASGVSGTSLPAAAVLSKAEAQVSIEVASNPILVGDPAKVIVRVASPLSGGGKVDGGVVQLYVGQAWQLSAVVNAGVATFTVPANLAAGAYNLQASYRGDSFAMSYAPWTSLYVERRVVSLSGELPAVVRQGDVATYTAVLTPLGASFAPTGGVLFLSGGVPIGFSQVALAADGRYTATLTTSRQTTPGDFYLQMVYLGGPQAYAATSGVYRLRVAAGMSTGGVAPAITAAPAPSPIVPMTPTGSSSAPAVRTSSSGRVYREGEDATFNVPSGTAAASIQWQVSRDGGANWGDIPGAVDPWVRLRIGWDDDGARYRARLVSGSGAVSTTEPETVVVAPWTSRVVCTSPNDFPWVAPLGRDVTIWVRVQTPGNGYLVPAGTITATVGSYTTTTALQYGGAWVTVPAAAVALGLNRVRVVYDGSDSRTTASWAENVFMVTRQASVLTADVPAEATVGGPLSYSVEASVQTHDFAPKGGVVVLANGQPVGFYPLNTGDGRSWQNVATSLPAGDVYLQFVYLGEPRAAMASSGVYKVTIRPRAVAQGAAVSVAPKSMAAVAVPTPATRETSQSTRKPPATATTREAIRPAWASRMRIATTQTSSTVIRRSAGFATVDQR